MYIHNAYVAVYTLTLGCHARNATCNILLFTAFNILTVTSCDGSTSVAVYSSIA
jgi:hypothetical protein